MMIFVTGRSWSYLIEKNIPEKSTIQSCSIINTMMMDTLLISVRTLSALSWIGTENTFGTK